MSHLRKALEKAKAERLILLSGGKARSDRAEEIDDIFDYLHKRIDETFDLRQAQLAGKVEPAIEDRGLEPDVPISFPDIPENVRTGFEVPETAVPEKALEPFELPEVEDEEPETLPNEQIASVEASREPEVQEEPTPSQRPAADDFGYTRTRVVNVSEDLLLKNRLFAVQDDNPVNDQIKLLRTRLFQNTRLKGLNTIQVSGFTSGDGASLLALNLALSIAKDTRQTTLLADLNFRKPSIARMLGLEESMGLRSYLLDGVPLEEIFVSPGIRKLTLLLSGGVIGNPTELLGSPKMETLVRELKERYDDRYVIFDTPGIAECPDPLVISEYVDGIILVARAHHTSQSCVKAAINLLPREKILGVVLNDVQPDELNV